MNKVYLVYKDNGLEYEDNDSWVEYVTTTLEKAKEILMHDGYLQDIDSYDADIPRFTHATECTDDYLIAWIIEKDVTQ